MRNTNRARDYHGIGKLNKSRVITIRNWSGLLKSFVILCWYTEDTSETTQVMKERKYMKKENKLEIESVSYEYVGTDKEFNAFLKNVIREYIDDDKTSGELVFETHIEEINIA